MNQKTPRLQPRVLIIGYVWPEVTSSAAGLRDWNLIETFQRAGWEIFFASVSAKNSHSERIEKVGIQTTVIQVNHPSFDEWLTDLQPDYVIFDRFVTEEQFGWRVQERCPNAIRILDTVDLHFLRRARQRALESAQEVKWVSDDFF